MYTWKFYRSSLFPYAMGASSRVETHEKCFSSLLTRWRQCTDMHLLPIQSAGLRFTWIQRVNTVPKFYPSTTHWRKVWKNVPRDAWAMSHLHDITVHILAPSSLLPNFVTIYCPITASINKWQIYMLDREIIIIQFEDTAYVENLPRAESYYSIYL